MLLATFAGGTGSGGEPALVSPCLSNQSPVQVGLGTGYRSLWTFGPVSDVFLYERLAGESSATRPPVRDPQPSTPSSLVSGLLSLLLAAFSRYRADVGCLDNVSELRSLALAAWRSWQESVLGVVPPPTILRASIPHHTPTVL